MAAAAIEPALLDTLKKHGQEHLVKFFDQLTTEEQQHLLGQLREVDFPQTALDFVRATTECQELKLDQYMSPIADSMAARATSRPPTDEMNAWRTHGLQLIAQGKVACILLAGGQGTRLGSSDPKGMYDLELPSKSTLFHVQALRLRRLQQLAREAHGGDGRISWYIMTSDSTQAPTIAFFEKHAFFGLDRNDIVFFPQTSVPALGNDGKLILSSKSSLALSPDGNGGLYSSLRRQGIVEDMERRGVVHVHVYCVDNILVRVADPTFVGHCAAKGAPAGAVIVSKSGPEEKVGVLCKVKETFQVVEYSEIELHTAQLRNADGQLTYNAGNICNHYFTTAFLKICCARCNELKLHVAKKKIPTVDEEGKPYTPAAENGIKLEKFVFDVFAFSPALAALEMPREDIFSPLKNKTGANSAATCRSDFYALCRRYLHNAGAVFEDETGAEIPLDKCTDVHVCEISPLLTYAGEGLEAYVKAHPRLRFPIVLNSL